MRTLRVCLRENSNASSAFAERYSSSSLSSGALVGLENSMR